MEIQDGKLISRYKDKLLKNENIIAIIYATDDSAESLPNTKKCLRLLSVEDTFCSKKEKLRYQEGETTVYLQTLDCRTFSESIQFDINDEYQFIYMNIQILYEKENCFYPISKYIESNRDFYFNSRMMLEFSLLLHKYYKSRELYRNEKYLDSYNQLLDGMVHWAKIIVYETHEHPRRDLWDQVREYDLGVYKLYEELTFSEEPLLQRIELMQLVYCNKVLSKTSFYGQPLIEYIRRRSKPVSYREIMNESPFSACSFYVDILLNEMIQRNIVMIHKKKIRTEGSKDNTKEIAFFVK